jgi:hypothetical protein
VPLQSSNDGRRSAMLGNGDINRGRFEPRKVYRGAPLYRPRKAKANPMPHLYFVLGALVFGRGDGAGC